MIPPNTDVFRKILLFLISKIMPPPKLENFGKEVPATLVTLGYPYRLNSGYWTGCVTKMAWPKLLGVCTWVMELVDFSEMASSLTYKERTKEINMDINKIDIDLETSYYRRSLQGATLDDLTKAYEQKLESDSVEKTQKLNKLQNHLADLERKNTDIKQKIRDNESTMQKIRYFENKILMMNNEIDLKNKEKLSLQNFLSVLQTKEQKLTEYIQKNDIRIESLKKQIGNQSITAEEALKLNKTLYKLHTDKDNALCEKVYYEKKMEEMEIANKKEYEKLKAYAEKYNQYGIEIDIMPLNSKYSNGVNFQLYLPNLTEFETT
eukprot:UN06966